MPIELPDYAVPQTAGMPVNSDTLQGRTRGRTAQLESLAKMRAKCEKWKMAGALAAIDNRVHQVKVIQRVDKRLTKWYRESLGEFGYISSKSVLAKRYLLVNEWSYKLSKEQSHG